MSANDGGRFRQASHLVVEDRRNDHVQIGGLAKADFAGGIWSTAFKGGGDLLEALQSPSPRCRHRAVISIRRAVISRTGLPVGQVCLLYTSDAADE